MNYPEIPDFKKIYWDIVYYGNLKTEFGASGFADKLKQAEKGLLDVLEEVKALPEDPEIRSKEPDDLSTIKTLRPEGKRRLWKVIPWDEYRRRLHGAFAGRAAGCTLGSIVECWPIEKMEAWSRKIGQQFPPVDYWADHPEPDRVRYLVSQCRHFTSSEMDGIPTDDDILYTLIGLLIMERFGPEFTTEEVGRAWLKHIPMAYNAASAALRNLKNGVSAEKAAEIDNPYCQWIGGDIRSDPWAYMAPGWPEKAAEFVYRDSFLTNRRNGIYAAMYFSAVIAAAFTVNDPMDALRIGLEEIPAQCRMADTVRWALDKKDEIANYKDARDAVDEKFKGMDAAHSLNNACLTIWGIHIGGTDITTVLSETVAMGLDNDCTAATAGSIVGAVIGIENIPEHWYRNFNNKVLTYMIDHNQFELNDLLNRFEAQAERVFDYA